MPVVMRVYCEYCGNDMNEVDVWDELEASLQYTRLVAENEKNGGKGAEVCPCCVKENENGA